MYLGQLFWKKGGQEHFSIIYIFLYIVPWLNEVFLGPDLGKIVKLCLGPHSFFVKSVKIVIILSQDGQ